MSITIKEYLDKRGIEYRQSGKELVTKCLFGGCDDDSKGNEAHLYFDAETGQYHCKKCDAKGNLVTLAKHFGDDLSGEADLPVSKPKKAKLDSTKAEECHRNLPENIRKYLIGRGITDELIDLYKLGWGSFYQRNWITIPIFSERGELLFFKLRREPTDDANPDKYKFFPLGSESTLYGLDTIQTEDASIVICEGEFDRLLLLANGIPAVSSTTGAGTFKEEWVVKFAKFDKVYTCFDNDEQGKQGAAKVAELLGKSTPEVSVYNVVWPEGFPDKGDVTDYFVSQGGNPDELLYELAKHVAGAEPIDTSSFQPMSHQELADILGVTIKKDVENKTASFLCQLSAYTENDQFNISFNAPSSTGKSYIPTEIARLFPSVDVKEIGYCSPTAFFHDIGEYDKEREGYIIDLSRKILIFLDQPHDLLLQHLRPLLSHDQKEISLKITDKTQKFGLKTKTILMRGYPSVIFCTAGLKFDEQEATRFLLLSPEVDQEKIREGISNTIRRESDNGEYQNWLNQHPGRKLLKDRVKAIKREKITEVKLVDGDEIARRFFENRPVLKPRHQRDVRRLMSLIKATALLNMWWRAREDTTITANMGDVEAGFAIWNKISVSQELSIPPYVYNLYREVILPAWQNKNGSLTILGVSSGVTRQDILQKHFDVYGRPLDSIQLRQQILPMLETAGLIYQEDDQNDKRKKLVFPVNPPEPENNSEPDGGVNGEEANG